MEENAKYLERYRELKKELENGQHQLDLLENRKTALERTLLRISGAIQVLEELGVSDDEDESKDSPEISSDEADG